MVFFLFSFLKVMLVKIDMKNRKFPYIKCDTFRRKKIKNVTPFLITVTSNCRSSPMAWWTLFFFLADGPIYRAMDNNFNLKKIIKIITSSLHSYHFMLIIIPPKILCSVTLSLASYRYIIVTHKSNKIHIYFLNV